VVAGLVPEPTAAVRGAWRALWQRGELDLEDDRRLRRLRHPSTTYCAAKLHRLGGATSSGEGASWGSVERCVVWPGAVRARRALVEVIRAPG
jgi:hypothetical protein